MNNDEKNKKSKETKKNENKSKKENNKENKKEEGQVKNNDAPFSKEMIIGEIIAQFPGSAYVMMTHGLHCIGCAIGSFESLADGCAAHGMSEEEADKIIDEINQLWREKQMRESLKEENDEKNDDKKDEE